MTSVERIEKDRSTSDCEENRSLIVTLYIDFKATDIVYAWINLSQYILFKN